MDFWHRFEQLIRFGAAHWAASYWEFCEIYGMKLWFGKLFQLCSLPPWINIPSTFFSSANTPASQLRHVPHFFLLQFALIKIVSRLWRDANPSHCTSRGEIYERWCKQKTFSWLNYINEVMSESYTSRNLFTRLLTEVVSLKLHWHQVNTLTSFNLFDSQFQWRDTQIWAVQAECNVRVSTH